MDRRRGVLQRSFLQVLSLRRKVVQKMTKRKALAEAIYRKMHGEVTSFDPFTILAIINAIVTVVKIWRECMPEDSTEEQVLGFLHNSGPFSRKVQRRIIRNALYNELPPDQFIKLKEKGMFAFEDAFFALADSGDKVFIEAYGAEFPA